ncbi:hypothetical protein [Planctomyces sp. SH-PL62]|uniref:DUF7691 family protein n=1 Tax=Planctomyces sp. SH-PL62 TaxID=1636152 RepID=UPI00078D2EBA|nr:hypothetical protein [Planctomyces sp. SH-PL62]AMV36766.1 hypothetical protein VT85_05000 [Planctomyces sp. SH-PL62]
MAINGTAYAVDLDLMRAAFGSRDGDLLGRIVEAAASTIESFDLQEDEPPSYSLRQALADLIDGDCRAPERSRFLYGYAIDILSEYFGEVIPVPEDDFDEVGDPEDLEIDSPLLNGQLPLPVPAWGDTPYVRFLTPPAGSRRVQAALRCGSISRRSEHRRRATDSRLPVEVGVGSWEGIRHCRQWLIRPTLSSQLATSLPDMPCALRGSPFSYVHMAAPGDTLCGTIGDPCEAVGPVSKTSVFETESEGASLDLGAGVGTGPTRTVATNRGGGI